jgi:colanic acid/amylovoran biosynthesis glycosyltransferase
VTGVVGYLLDRHLQTSQTFVSNEIEEMRAQGVQVVVVALRRGDRELGSDQPALYLEDLPLTRDLVVDHLRWLLRHPVRYARFLNRVFRLREDMGPAGEMLAWQRLPRAATYLQRASVDVLHAHFAWWGATAAACLAPLLDRPFSIVLHAKDIFSKQRCLPQKLVMADTLITVCDYNLQWMREHLALSRPVPIVVCGVRLPDHNEPRVGDADVLLVGRLIEKKGVDVLIRAAAQLSAERPGLRIDIVGDGPLRTELEELARSLGLGQRVRFLGKVAHPEVLSRIGAARVLCLPARIAGDGDRDSMPVVIKEAMVRRVPVVGTDVAAIPEMLSDGCGVLVAPDDPVALAAALAQLLDDSSLRDSVVGLAYARAVERFTLAGEVVRLRGLLLPSPSVHATLG